MLQSSVQTLFCNNLGTLHGKVHLQVDPDCKPVVLPPRNVPVSILKTFEQLLRLESVKAVNEPTEWVNQAVVAVKKSGELHLCIDPKPLNAAFKREHYQITVIDDLLPDLANARVFFKVYLAAAFWHLELDPAWSHPSPHPMGGFVCSICRLISAFQTRSQKDLHQALNDLPMLYLSMVPAMLIMKAI